jgi:hypothetical protein
MATASQKITEIKFFDLHTCDSILFSNHRLCRTADTVKEKKKNVRWLIQRIVSSIHTHTHAQRERARARERERERARERESERQGQGQRNAGRQAGTLYTVVSIRRITRASVSSVRKSHFERVYLLDSGIHKRRTCGTRTSRPHTLAA